MSTRTLIIVITLIGILGGAHFANASGKKHKPKPQPKTEITNITNIVNNYYDHKCNGSAGAAAIGSHQYFITNSNEISFAGATNGECTGFSVGTYYRVNKDFFITGQVSYEPEAEVNEEMFTIQGTYKF